MIQTPHALPDPIQEAVVVWLCSLDREYLHGEGWIEMNKRFHGIAMAARQFVRENFKTVEQQEAAFDGLALGLLALAHFSDIERLGQLFEIPAPNEPKPEESADNRPQIKPNNTV